MRRGAKALVILGVSIPAALFDDGRLFLFVPVLINAALLVAFGRTLVNGPSMVDVLIATLFAAEIVYRYWRFRPYDGSVTDPLFRRIFPPRGSG
jgi:uncharacterized membrane protein